MKSYIREFYYSKNDNDIGRWRKVIIMNDTTDKIEGFDLTYLSKDEQKAAIKLLCGTHNVHNRISGRPSHATPIQGLDTNWFKGWRLFSKDKIEDFYNFNSFAKQLINSGKTRSKIVENVKRNLYKAFESSDTPTCYGITFTNVEKGFKRFAGIRVLEYV